MLSKRNLLLWLPLYLHPQTSALMQVQKFPSLEGSGSFQQEWRPLRPLLLLLLLSRR